MAQMKKIWYNDQSDFVRAILISEEKKMKYNAIFFDVDGTLIDSAPGIRESFAYTFHELGISDEGLDYNQFFGPPLRRSYAKFLSDPEEIERAVELYRAYYHKKGRHDCSLYPGVKEMLQVLREQRLVLCTATSKPIHVVTPILQELGIANFFDKIGGASKDASIDTKTAVIQSLLADPFLKEKKILMVGDRCDDMIGAAECALDAAGVLYGYGSREEIEPYHPVYMAKNCNELVNYILEGDSDE